MEIESMLTEYFNQRPEMASRDRTRTRESVKIFIERGITEPLQSDYDNILKTELQARNVSDTTIRGYAGCARKFYKWQKEHQKGDRQMNEFSFGVTEKESGIERQEETESATMTAEGISDMATAKTDNSPSASETESVMPQSDSDADMSNSENEAPVIEKPKRGRPKKAEADRSKRKQISVYLEPEIYEGIQTLAFIKHSEVTKVAEIAITEIVKENADQILEAEAVKKTLNEIEAKLQRLNLNL